MVLLWKHIFYTNKSRGMVFHISRLAAQPVAAETNRLSRRRQCPHLQRDRRGMSQASSDLNMAFE